MSKSLARKHRDVNKVIRYYEHCGWHNVGLRRATWFKRCELRRRALVHAWHRQHGQKTWSDFGIELKGGS